MKTNDIKKGTRFRLRNGWEATMEDNKKGNIRLATVYGMFTEMGSVYGHDIVMVLNLEENTWETVEHTPAQIKALNTIGSMY